MSENHEFQAAFVSENHDAHVSEVEDIKAENSAALSERNESHLLSF